MPQGRRKIPFSGKAKKEQLKAKKQSKTIPPGKKVLLLHNSDDEEDNTSVQKLNFQPKGGRNTNRYVLQFFRETDAEIKENKEKVYQSLEETTEKDLEINVDDYFTQNLDFPRRPPWSFKMTTAQLEMQENKYFSEYVTGLEKLCYSKELSFFELNLETWRQLWRVLEMSDILLIIVDIRYAALGFPPSLYKYVEEQNKHLILVLNKIDLAPAPLVAAWKNYFEEKYPEIHVLMFTVVPGYNLREGGNKGGLQIRRRKGKIRMAAEGTQMLYDICKSIVGDSVDLNSWQQKIKEEMSMDFEDDSVEIDKKIECKNVETGYYNHEKFSKGILTIGCIGQPNVGKSSLINAIMGKKVVSVSKTPGHTKHFQTIFLTPNVQLCDCPGLVFPSKIPKVLQVLMGSFPIAQLREPYAAIKYLAERLDLPKLLKMDHPEGDDQWSAMDICNGWAKKKGFLTAKAARLDSYRAANNLLRMALDGKICLCLKPPNYKEEHWSEHVDVETVKWIQAKNKGEQTESTNDLDFNSEDSDEAAGDAGKNETENRSCSDDDSEGIVYNKFNALNVESE